MGFAPTELLQNACAGMVPEQCNANRCGQILDRLKSDSKRKDAIYDRENDVALIKATKADKYGNSFI